MIANQSHRSEWNEIYTMQTSYKYQKLIQCLRLLMTGQVQVGRKSASCTSCESYWIPNSRLPGEGFVQNCECRSKVSVYSNPGSAHSPTMSHGLCDVANRVHRVSMDVLR
ncbi:hypothetical protein SCLCIDRAFT_774413 [Scleroderma citrinum Foug A]|uniref:Uncharacterized protein n=1 Tax=Scleroderma citrinum Foug A TaxID=1036808 RepID=A0A0C3E3K9_9AGAM|nr:hypothetical protein SCLCIDRAFT_774413 [Scleroderma citrinum Foug A]